jgi:hypothetical protein
VQSKDGEGSWVDWVTATALTTSDFAGEDGHTYYFRCRAMDNAGNPESFPDEADAQTTVVLGPGSAWESAFGGSMGDDGTWVQQTADGGYIVTGNTYSFGEGGRDVYLVKANATGGLEWEEAYGGSEVDGGMSVRQTDDGGYVVAGSTRCFGAGESDIYVVKVSSSGAWERDLVYGGPSAETASCVSQTLDGGYIITGQAYSSGKGYDVCILKVTSEGVADWYKIYGGDAGKYGRAVEEVSSGGYIVTGGTHSFGAGGRDVYLLKVDSGGEVEWEETYGGVIPVPS